ncbi:hypothetical protein [Hoeflea sp.]|uniref:hypothetical protein n=1 Tax=Hoeflea sp. TaxID=1940281 RepID=UPI003B01A5D5
MSGVWQHRLGRGVRAAWSVIRPLLNATLLLAVVAAIAGLMLMHSTRALVDNTMADVKSGVLREIDEDAKRLFAEMDGAYAEFDRLKQRIDRIVDDPQSLLDEQVRQDIRAVKNDLHGIAEDLDRISRGQLDISQETLEKLAISLVRTYGQIRGCKVAELTSGRSQQPVPVQNARP